MVVVHTYIFPLPHYGKDYVQTTVIISFVLLFCVVLGFVYIFIIFSFSTYWVRLWNRQSLMNSCVKMQVAIFVLMVLYILYCILFVLFHSWNVVHRPFGLWCCILEMQCTKFFGGMCDTVNLAYLVHWVHVWFYFHFSYLKLCKPLVIMMQTHQCFSALLLTE